MSSEQSLSDVDRSQYVPLEDEESVDQKAGHHRLGSDDSGVGLNNEQDTPS